MGKLIRPVICIGVDQITKKSVIPLMCVDFFKFNQRSKRIFINWTYGYLNGDKIEFDSELGEIKLFQLQMLELDGDVQARFMFPSERGRTFSERIREIIDNAEDGARVLFVMPKDIPDSEFYAALSVSVDPSSGEVEIDKKVHGDPVLSLKELGVNIGEPFVEIDPRR